jgi:hypothetical protein
MCWPVSLSLFFFLCLRSPIIFPSIRQKKYKKLACFVRLPGSLSMGHQKKKENNKKKEGGLKRFWLLPAATHKKEKKSFEGVNSLAKRGLW